MSRLLLPVPPSANRYWRSTIQYVGGKAKVRVLLSAEGRAFKELAALLARAQRCAFHAGDVRLSGVVYFDSRRRDLDNILKPLGDALANGIAYKNDRQIRHIDIRAAIDRNNPRAEITITPIEDTSE